MCQQYLKQKLKFPAIDGVVSPGATIYPEVGVGDLIRLNPTFCGIADDLLTVFVWSYTHHCGEDTHCIQVCFIGPYTLL